MISKKISTTLLILGILTQAASANITKKTPPKYWSHFKEAGTKYGIDPKILVAIAENESSINHKAINKANRNKTIDVGVMQINSCHFKKLKSYTNDLNDLYDARFNIHVGAWVLKKCINRFGVNWKSVDCYNKGPGNAHFMSGYVKRVNKNYEKIRHAKWN